MIAYLYHCNLGTFTKFHTAFIKHMVEEVWIQGVFELCHYHRSSQHVQQVKPGSWGSS